MYVVHYITLSDSFRIRIVWFQPKQDSDRIRILFFKNRIGSDSKIHYLIISAAHFNIVPNGSICKLLSVYLIAAGAAKPQLSERFRIWIGYRSPHILIFGYGLDMEFMKKFRIGSGWQNVHIRTPLVRTAKLLWLVAGRLHSAFFFRTHIRGKKFVKAGLGFRDTHSTVYTHLLAASADKLQQKF